MQTVIKLLLASVLIFTVVHSYKSFSVDFSDTPKPLDHFWRSCGFTPAILCLGADEAENLAMIGSIPHDGIFFVRIHSLLDLLYGKDFGKPTKSYNWTDLDHAISLVVDNGLHPQFEIMGNPSSWWTDFTNKTQLYAWKEMITDVANHFIQKYGLDEVKLWHFESWNEPRLVPKMFPSFQHLANFYDASSQGLKEAHPSLIFGGPAASSPNEYWKQFLAHCDGGINYFTGEKGSRLDFISIHNKGRNVATNVLKEDISAINYIRGNHPRFTNTTFFNDEGDPLVGWNKPEEWRADVTYAAMELKVLKQHLNHIIYSNTFQPPVHFGLLSNDNGFMGDGSFKLRTLNARLSNVTNPGNNNVLKFETIRKPSFNVMLLLSLIGTHSYDITSSDGCNDPNVCPMNGIATLEETSKESVLSVILYWSTDTTAKNLTENVTVTIKNIPQIFTPGSSKVALYRLDNNHGSVYGVWESMGKPSIPTEDQLLKLRYNQNPTLDFVKTFEPNDVGQYSREVEMRLPGIVLLQICHNDGNPPEQVKNVRVTPKPQEQSLINKQQNWIMWDSSSSKCIQTYQVYAAPTKDGEYVQANQGMFLTKGFMHIGSPDLWYKVNSIDLWGRKSIPSIPVTSK